ncbi:5'-3' exonuclease [Stenotrophomonas phage vB_SmeS_BUCT700]|uniref:5'-3' exonuclease n=1 Tax=Stenotrophomonas phage vB_SmeS_BUCT700 TaxID=2924895 RepID=A0AAE9GB75_9CAUD|nr:5'-3' exonuclease [Stenotrophomonas phage vB_SmeS_BUCT700]UNY50291.1 5'-3' exonuclease [Stenotrophomonas phage vB_SmeS_BUCT703]
MLSAEQKAKLAAHAKDNAMPGFTARPFVPGMVLLVDGDYLAYYCAGNDDTEPHMAWSNLIDRLDRAKLMSGADIVVIHLSTYDCDKGLRFLVSDSPTSKPYQGQRNTGRKPKNWAYLRERMDTYEGVHFQVVQWKDREADDGMAMAAEFAVRRGDPVAILTADKDMRMFAGTHMVWKTFQMVDVPLNAYDVFAHGKQYGHKWFWMQMLMGDTADNIVGLPRVGEVAAEKALAGTTNNWQAFCTVLDMYKSKMKDAYTDHFVEQATLLWMRTGASATLLDWMPALGLDWGTDVRRAAERMVQRVNNHIGNPRNAR